MKWDEDSGRDCHTEGGDHRGQHEKEQRPSRADLQTGEVSGATSCEASSLVSPLSGDP